MVPDWQPRNIILALLSIISFLNFTIPAPLSGNAPQQIAQCPGNEIYGYVNGTQIGKRQDYIHLEMEDLDLEECIKQCYGNHFCYSIYYDETLKNRCVFYYFAGYNCTGRPLILSSNLKYEGKPITFDCIRCPGKGDIISTTEISTVGNINVNSIGANINQQISNTGDSSSNDMINQIPNSSDNSSCILEFIPNFEDVGDEIGELFTNVINDIKDERECAKLCHKSNCDYAVYKPLTKTCSFISDYFGFIKNCSSRPLQNFIIGVMESKIIETIQIECIRCRQNHIEDVKNIFNNQIKHSSHNNNEGEWHSMTVDPGDAVTWPTNLQLSGHCIVVFQIDESQETLKNIEFSNTTELQTVEQCAAYCYKSSCSNAVFEFLEHGKGLCKISTKTADTCSGNLQHHYRFYTTKSVLIQCIRCLAKKPTTHSPHALMPGSIEITTTSIPELKTSSLSPEQQYESNEGGGTETKTITSSDGIVDKGGEVDDDIIMESSHKKTAGPPSSAPVDEIEIKSGATLSTNNGNTDEKESVPLSTTEISMTDSSNSKEKITIESVTTTTLLPLTTIETLVENKTISQQTKEKEDAYLRSCIVTFQVKPFSLIDEPREDEPLMEFEFITDSVTICASKCYNNGCTGAIYNSETKKCVLQLGKVLKCIGGDTYNNYFPEKNEKIRIFCLSCTPSNLKGIEGQIKSNKNAEESIAVTSTTELNKEILEVEDNHSVTSSPSIKPGSVFDKMTTKPNEENKKTSIIVNKKDKEEDQSSKSHTVDQSIETTTLSIKNHTSNETLENKEMATSLPKSINENESTTSIPLEEKKENIETSTKISDLEEKEEDTMTTASSKSLENNEQTTISSDINKKSETSNIDSDVEGSGISSTLSENEDKQTTLISQNRENNNARTDAPEVTKEERKTTVSLEKEETQTSDIEEIKETTIMPITENDKSTVSSKVNENEDLTTSTFVTKEGVETTIVPESENSKKITTITNKDGEDNEAKISSTKINNEEVETTTSQEIESSKTTNIKDIEEINITQTTFVDSQDKMKTTSVPETDISTVSSKNGINVEETNVTTPVSEGSQSKIDTTMTSIVDSKEDENDRVTTSVQGSVNENIDTTTIPQSQKEDNEIKTTHLENMENFKTTTIAQELPTKSSNVENTFETTTINPELGLEISKDNKSSELKKPSESESVLSTTISSENIEQTPEITTILPESETESSINKNKEETATTLLIPVDFETTTDKGLDNNKNNEEASTLKPIFKDKSETDEPLEGSGIDEIEGKASTIINITDEPTEKEISTTEGTKTTIIPIIDSEQNTENLFPEEKKLTTGNPIDIASTTISTIAKESPSSNAEDKFERTTISSETEKTELETVQLTEQNTTSTIESDKFETTTFSLPEMGLEISRSKGLQTTIEKNINKTDDKIDNDFTTKLPDELHLNPKDEINVKEFEREDESSTTLVAKVEENNKKLSVEGLDTTTAIIEFEKGDEDKPINSEDKNSELETTIVFNSDKQSILTTTLPEELAKKEEVQINNEQTNKSSTKVSEENLNNESKTTVISDTEEMTTTIIIQTESKKKENDVTSIAPNVSEDNGKTTVRFTDEEKIITTTTTSIEKETTDVTTVASKSNEASKSGINREDDDLVEKINSESETTIEAVDFENKQTTMTLPHTVNEFSTSNPEIKESKGETENNKEFDTLTTVSPENEKDLTKNPSEVTIQTEKSKTKNIPESEHTVEEGSGEGEEEESGEPTSITGEIDNENDKTTTVSAIGEEKLTETSKALIENETIEPSTISLGNEFIATTPNDLNEFKTDIDTTTPNSLNKTEKKEEEITTTLNTNEKNGESKSSTILTTVDFESSGKPLQGNAFGEKGMVLQTTISPEKEEGSTDKQTTFLPENKVISGENHATHFPENEEGSTDIQTTSLPVNKIISGDNHATHFPEDEEESTDTQTTFSSEHKVNIGESQTTPLPESEEGSTESQTQPTKEHKNDSDINKEVIVNEKEKESMENQSTSIPELKEDFDITKTTQSQEKETVDKEKLTEGNDKEEFESSGKELVDNQEFSSNNTNGLPEMGLEISRFRGLSGSLPNKTEETNVFPKTSHNEDENFSVTISTEINKGDESTSPIDLDKKLESTTIQSIKIDSTDNFESSGINDSTEPTVISSKTTTTNVETTGKESEEGNNTTKEISLDSITTVLPEAESSGIEEESKTIVTEIPTIKSEVELKNAEELFPDDEQIERIRTQSSTTKSISETVITTTEPSGSAFVTENSEQSEEKETPIKTTVKYNFSTDLSTVETTFDDTKSKVISTQVSEVIITTTAIPIDEQLFTIQPFKGLDNQLPKKNQTANNLTIIPVDTKENEQNNQFTTESTFKTDNQELSKEKNIIQTTIIPEIKADNNNEEVEVSTMPSGEGSGEEIATTLINDSNLSGVSQTTVPTTKTNEDSLTIVSSTEKEKQSSDVNSFKTTETLIDDNDNIKTTVSVNKDKNDNEEHIETTIPTIHEEKSNEATTKTDKETIIDSEQEDSNVTVEPLLKSTDFDLGKKISTTTEEKVHSTKVPSVSNEETTNFEGSGEEVETTTQENQKSDKFVTKQKIEDESLFTTILPITKIAIIKDEDKTTILTPLKSGVEGEQNDKSDKEIFVKNDNATTLNKSSSKNEDEKVIITASTVKTILNETNSSNEDTNDENKKPEIQESFKQDNSQTTEGSLQTTQKPTTVEIKKEHTTTKEIESEGPAFVTESPEISETKEDHFSVTILSPTEDINKSKPTEMETFDKTTESLSTSTGTVDIEKVTSEQIDDKVEELIPQEKKKEDELDASKIDFGPTTTLKMGKIDGEITTIEPAQVSDNDKELQSTTSTIITEDDGSIIDTSILKTGTIDTSNPKETDVTLISGDSIATTLNVKNEEDSEVTTVKTNLNDKIETIITNIPFTTESIDLTKTTIESDEIQSSKNDINKNEMSTISQEAFVTDKTEISTHKVKTDSEINVETTTFYDDTAKKISIKPNSNIDISSSNTETTVLPESEGITLQSNENIKHSSQETTTSTIIETTNNEEKDKNEQPVAITMSVENLTTQQPSESEDRKSEFTKVNEETTVHTDNEEINSTISPEEKTNIDNIENESKVKTDETTPTLDEIQTTIIPETKISSDLITTQSTEESTERPIKAETIDFVSVTTTVSSHQNESTSSDLTTTEATSAETKLVGTAESIDAVSIDKHINLPKTVGKVDSKLSSNEKPSKDSDSEEKLSDKDDYEDKILTENNDSESQNKVYTTTEPPVEAVADLVHTLTRTNDLDLLLRGATKQLVDIRKNAKCGVNTLRFAARPMKDFSQEYEVIESVTSLYACLETCYITGCKKAAFVPYPQPKCLMHYELGSKLTNSCTTSSVYQLTTHWHFSNPSEVIEILCLVCDNDNENSNEKLQIENVFNILIDDKRKGMEQQAFITEICNGAGRLEFQVKPVSKFPRLNITHDVPANSPAECAMKCKENNHCDLAGFVPSPHAKSSGLCLLTSDTHYCDHDDETYKHVPQHQSEVPFLLHCIRCSKCRYNMNPVIPGITEVIPFETTKTVNNIEECALQCSNSKCTVAQFNPKSSTCSTTINPSFKNTCPTEKALQVDGSLQIRLHCVSCTN
ncbi:Hypothetical protein SRAE_X000128600 [Strongyloides ratti]|uniref:PAN-1 domain and Apple-like domain-containing protein n=1 Tax=Strongyloides ratti TaxID=34506 RepID=A0A090KQ81_STRRB|nr:Hypothetical protein SRAE_X000128600 [Strongyloides ratti]CEF59539.1 Hypothetical protein SRAE_X000128600 [Strongyloides ratti]